MSELTVQEIVEDIYGAEQQIKQFERKYGISSGIVTTQPRINTNVHEYARIKIVVRIKKIGYPLSLILNPKIIRVYSG